MWCDIVPYKDLLLYKSAFEATIDMTDTIEINLSQFNGERTVETIWGGNSQAPNRANIIWTYMTNSYGVDYTLVKYGIPKAGSFNYDRMYIIAKQTSDPSDRYSSEVGKKVAKEILSIRKNKHY